MVHVAHGNEQGAEREIIMQPGKVRDDIARRFFYTAITRAKTHLSVVSALSAVGWWTNACAEMPSADSSLMQRLALSEPCADLEPDCHPELLPLMSAVSVAAEVIAVQSWRTLRQKVAPIPEQIAHPDLHKLYRSLVAAGRE